MKKRLKGLDEMTDEEIFSILPTKSKFAVLFWDRLDLLVHASNTIAMLFGYWTFVWWVVEKTA